MKQIKKSDVKTGQYITLINPPKMQISYFNQMEQEVSVQEVLNTAMVGRIYKVEAVDLPFLLISDVITDRGFTLDVRNIVNDNDLRIVDNKYRKKFQKMFTSMPQNTSGQVFTMSNSNIGQP